MTSIETTSIKLIEKVEERLKMECLEQPGRSIILFGEDAFRFDFFTSAMEALQIPAHQIRLETPFDTVCFVENKIQTRGRGRKSSKPKYDLGIVAPEGSVIAAVEFGLFKQTEIAEVQDKSGRLGKLLNDFVRLSSLRLSSAHQDTKLYVVLLSDGEMMNYGMGKRGKRTDPIFQDYQVTPEYLMGLSETTRAGIDLRFLNKLVELKKYATAKMIREHSGEFGGKGQYKLAVWQIELEA